MRIWQVGLLGLALGIGAARAQEPVPVGEEFQVNSYTTNFQGFPSVAADAAGSFVVTWQSNGSYGTDPSESIQGQRFDASGAPVGGQFQVNSYTTSGVSIPSVALDPEGDFVVVWESFGSYGTDSDRWSIQGQRFDATGTPAGSQFQVNTYTTSLQVDPAVAADAQGNFVVVWESIGSYGTDTSNNSIQGQLYDANGAPVGDQFQVNSFTDAEQIRPSVSVGASGTFVVVWESYFTDGSARSVQAQRFDANGVRDGGEFQVNSYTTGYQGHAAVAVNSLGNFVVVWRSDGSYGTDSSESSIQGQRYDASGTPLGGEFQVNSYTTGYQSRPTVAVGADGDFVVVWTSNGSYGTDTSYESIQGQRYDMAGNPVGGEFQINSYTTNEQWWSDVAVDSSGDFVVVWQSLGTYGTDTEGHSIQGQRYSTGAIFTDGFESGDTSAWSSTKP